MILRVLCLFLIMCCTAEGLAQSNERTIRKSDSRTSMVLSGTIKDEQGKPIVSANIEGPDGRYASSDLQGRFSIPANLGEEIIIRGAGFETVYYRIRSKDDLLIQVEDVESSSSSLDQLPYQVLMDSAQFYFKKNTQKTADFLTAALTNNPIELSKVKEALAYEKLADLYLYEKQYDLAVQYIKQALDIRNTSARNLKYATALRLNGNYQEAIKIYKAALENAGSTNTVALWTGLGNAYTATGDDQQAVTSFNKALSFIDKNENPNSFTRISALLASVLNKQGNIISAENVYGNAIAASKKQGVTSNVITQSQTADFYNSNANYDKEIELRKSNITLLENQNNNSIKPRESVVSDNVMVEEEVTAINPIELDDTAAMVTAAPTISQEQLKIADAFKAQNKIEEALSFYTESLETAMENNDLMVVKDAARSLSVLNRKAGNTTKALEYNDIYIEMVDAIYETREEQLELQSREARNTIAQQARIATLEKDRELSASKLQLYSTQQELTVQQNQRQRWIIYSLLAIVLLFMTIAYLMYRSNKQHKINNRLLALKSLHSQMNPHFIFNALNSVNNYIALNDERAANKYLADFSKLMRSVLENSELDFISLDKELELVSLYLKLEHERFKDKFNFKLEVDEKLDVHKHTVPPMLIQPIIENAVWHGLRYKETKGVLQVKFKAIGKDLQVTIKDDGIGRKQSQLLKTTHQKSRESKGIGNINNRIALLNELHNRNIIMAVNDLDTLKETGTVVTVTFKN